MVRILALCMVLVFALPSAMATVVESGEAQIIVTQGVLQEPIGVGDKFVTWLDTRTGDSEVYIMFLPHRSEFRLTQSLREDRETNAWSHWAVWSSNVAAPTQPGQPRPPATWDVFVYDVAAAKQVHQSSTTRNNETSPVVQGGRVAYLAFQGYKDGNQDTRVYLMDTMGANAFQARSVRESEHRQIHPALSASHLAFWEELPPGSPGRWQMLAMELPGGQPRVVKSPEAGVGFGEPVLDGSNLYWTEYRTSDNASLVRGVDLRTDQPLGPFIMPEANRTFNAVTVRGDLFVASTIKDAIPRLWAWCKPDGVPAPLSGLQQEAILPQLSDWGSVVYLARLGPELRIYERYLGCGAVPPSLSPPPSPSKDSPSPGSLLLLALLLGVAARVRRGGRKRTPHE